MTGVLRTVIALALATQLAVGVAWLLLCLDITAAPATTDLHTWPEGLETRSGVSAAVLLVAGAAAVLGYAVRHDAARWCALLAGAALASTGPGWRSIDETGALFPVSFVVGAVLVLTALVPGPWRPRLRRSPPGWGRGARLAAGAALVGVLGLCGAVLVLGVNLAWYGVDWGLLNLWEEDESGMVWLVPGEALIVAGGVSGCYGVRALHWTWRRA